VDFSLFNADLTELITFRNVVFFAFVHFQMFDILPPRPANMATMQSQKTKCSASRTNHAKSWAERK